MDLPSRGSRPHPASRAPYGARSTGLRRAAPSANTFAGPLVSRLVPTRNPSRPAPKHFFVGLLLLLVVALEAGHDLVLHAGRHDLVVVELEAEAALAGGQRAQRGRIGHHLALRDAHLDDLRVAQRVHAGDMAASRVEVRG